MSFRKIIEVDRMLRSPSLMSLEPSVQLITPGTSEGLSEKIASEAADWAKVVKPEEGKTFILVLALGASEYYGPNRNGDGFRESELKKTYKTFESDAHVFRSHVNKDPAKSIGKVLRAFFNDRMKRVELVLCIENSKAKDIADKIRDHESVAVSMGCRIKFDVCSICGNKAPTRKDYCKHAKSRLNEILPDGRQIFVDNPNPVFFDISVVWRPADRTGYMLKKVARDQERGESSAILAEKAATMTVLSSLLQKAADIEKVVRGVGVALPGGADSPGHSLASKWIKHVVPKILSEYKPISNEDLGWLSGKQFPKVLSSLSSMGIFLTTPEFLDLFVQSFTGKPAPAGAAQKLIDLQGSLFSFMASEPKAAYDVLTSGVVSLEEPPDPAIQEKMSGYISRRSLSPGNMKKMAQRGGLMETISYSDPRTGRLYVSNRDQAERAGEVEDMVGMAKLLGLGALSLGTYKALGRSLGRGAAIPALAAGGAGYGAAFSDNPDLITNEGYAVPSTTPFTERTGSVGVLSVRLAADRHSGRKALGRIPGYGDLDETAKKIGAMLLM